MTKICFVCGKELPIDMFYKHKAMGDGHLNKCKECCKRQSKLREETLRKDPLWCEKEKERSKEKYYRLNYRERQYELNKKSVYKNNAYKMLHKNLKLSKNVNAHHWNYNLIKDVIIMTKQEHRKAHKYLILDKTTLLFYTDEGVILDTKEKHIEFLESKGINFNTNTISYE
jgi:hypothetical protein